MQSMNKIEPQDTTSQNLQGEVKKLIDCLERGKKSAHMMRSLILQNNPIFKMENDDDNDQHQDHYKALLLLDHHSMVCLDTYASSLSMLKSLDFDRVFARKRKQEHLSEVDDAISEVSTDVGSPNMSTTVHCSRVSYKKGKNNDGESREEEVSHLTDDGFSWRKYGQKLILNTHYPRHYYRCTHRNDQKCQATKQVQQVSNNPTKYKLIYHYNHTCNNNNNLKTSPLTIDFPEDHPSAYFLSFDRSNQVNPMLFPTSTFPAAVATVNQTSSPSTSSNYNHSISQDTTVVTTTSTGLSSNSFSELSMLENCSSTASSLNLVEDDYSFIMADFSDYTLPADWWTN